MDMIRASAIFFSEVAYNVAKNDQPRGAVPTDKDVINAKIDFFNVCSVALIATVALGVLGALPTPVILLVGAATLFGRAVSDESFNVMRTSDGTFHHVMGSFNPMSWIDATARALKPTSLLSFGDIVILYAK